MHVKFCEQFADKIKVVQIEFTRIDFLFGLGPHDYNVKVSNFTFCRGRKHKTTTSFFFS